MVLWYKIGNIHNWYHIKNHEALKLDFTHAETNPPLVTSKALFSLQGILFMISSEMSKNISITTSVFNQSSLTFEKEKQLSSNFLSTFTKFMAIPSYVWWNTKTAVAPQHTFSLTLLQSSYFQTMCMSHLPHLMFFRGNKISGELGDHSFVFVYLSLSFINESKLVFMHADINSFRCFRVVCLVKKYLYNIVYLCSLI